MGGDPWTFYKSEYPKTSEYMKRCSISLVITEMKSSGVWRFHHTYHDDVKENKQVKDNAM